ncbi:MAG: oligosaccharide flippase family protein [candidate division WOR-3 bacterium]|nr:oligosaccharide flippase family protein [candidate division WOR-3 bacterium]
MNPEARSSRENPRSDTRRVATNTAYLALADVAGKVMVFLFYVLAARHLGVEKYGVLSFALAFTTMLGVLTDLGLGVITTREIARDPGRGRPQVNDALTIRLIASAIIIAVVAVLVNVLGYPGTTVRVVYVCSVCILTNAVITLFCAVFQGHERMELLALNRIAQTAVLIIGAFLLLRGPAVTERYAFLYVVAGVVSVVLAGINAVPLLGRPKLSFAFGQWGSLLRQSIPVGLATIFTMFYYWISSTLLSKMAGDAAVGSYSAAFRVANGLAFMGFAFSGAVYPLYSRLVAGSSERLARALELSIKYMAILALPVAAFGAVFGMQVVLLVYGREYAGAAPVLRLLVWWAAFASLNSLLSNYLIAEGQSGRVTAQTGVSLLLNIGLNLVLIPVYGAAGAAIAIVASEGVGLVYLAVSHSRVQHHAQGLLVFGGVLRVSVALAGALLAAAGVARWNWVAGLAAGLTVYFVLLVATRALGGRDVKMLRSLLGGGDPR